MRIVLAGTRTEDGRDLNEDADTTWGVVIAGTLLILGIVVGGLLHEREARAALVSMSIAALALFWILIRGAILSALETNRRSVRVAERR
jgi:hypothetical protein